jgi:hypothetical protein
MGDRIADSFSAGIARITAFVPNLLSALIIAVVGYLLSRLFGALAQRLLLRLGFDRFVARRLHPEAARRTSPSRAVGATIFWLGILTTATMVARALSLDALAGGLERILAYVPHVLVASIVLFVGIAVANLVANLLAGTASATIARIARAAIVVLASFMALDQLGIARGVVMTVFTAAVGAAAVAAAIAFGVGNRELAGRYTRRWAERAERARREPQAEEEAAEAAEAEAAGVGEPATEERLAGPPPDVRH